MNKNKFLSLITGATLSICAISISIITDNIFSSAVANNNENQVQVDHVVKLDNNNNKFLMKNYIHESRDETHNNGSFDISTLNGNKITFNAKNVSELNNGFIKLNGGGEINIHAMAKDNAISGIQYITINYVGNPNFGLEMSLSWDALFDDSLQEFTDRGCRFSIESGERIKTYGNPDYFGISTSIMPVEIQSIIIEYSCR